MASRSDGPGRVSSKSLRSIPARRSGEANTRSSTGEHRRAAIKQQRLAYDRVETSFQSGAGPRLTFKGGAARSKEWSWIRSGPLRLSVEIMWVSCGARRRMMTSAGQRQDAARRCHRDRERCSPLPDFVVSFQSCVIEGRALREVSGSSIGEGAAAVHRIPVVGGKPAHGGRVLEHRRSQVDRRWDRKGHAAVSDRSDRRLLRPVMRSAPRVVRRA